MSSNFITHILCIVLTKYIINYIIFKNVFLSMNYDFLSVAKNNIDFMGILKNLTMTFCQLKCIFVREL